MYLRRLIIILASVEISTSLLGPCSDCTGSYETCLTFQRGTICKCQTGFKRENITQRCLDIDECTGPNDCAKDTAICTNVPGSYHCHCIDGFAGDGKQCYGNIDDYLKEPEDVGKDNDDFLILFTTKQRQIDNFGINLAVAMRTSFGRMFLAPLILKLKLKEAEKMGKQPSENKEVREQSAQNTTTKAKHRWKRILTLNL